ncbi:NAD dependent epimerase/dehydratase [Bombardia bombarda]|uniref:NAD dependent epimerase/dehydratase n=1 Tax=Bombardia bombarda TaxID=252184 RepID=A0AA39X9G4_9PEZI|nr:NAD dependent epimerase/dehydratase [Bombardia bombarda]
MTMKVLVTGATGYIGGSFLAELLASRAANPWFTTLSISVLVRKQQEADYFAALGLTPILFVSLDDADFLRRTASEFDMVMHAANGHHPVSAQALVEGLGERRKATGRDVYHIQTSGSSNVADHPITGRHIHPPSQETFSDARDNIYSYMLARQADEPYLQRAADVAVVQIGLALGVKTYIVMPPTIYGLGLGPFHRYPHQGPTLIKGALESGDVWYIGEGKGEWSNVHIKDLARLYVLLMGKIVVAAGAGEDGPPNGERGVYFASTGKASWRDFAMALAKAGKELGALERGEAKSVSLKEFAERWTSGNEQLAEMALASRSVQDAELSRSLGWTPEKKDADFWTSIKVEFANILKDIKVAGVL